MAVISGRNNNNIKDNETTECACADQYNTPGHEYACTHPSGVLLFFVFVFPLLFFVLFVQSFFFSSSDVFVIVCLCVCVRACMHACVHAWMRARTRSVRP